MRRSSLFLVVAAAAMVSGCAASSPSRSSDAVALSADSALVRYENIPGDGVVQPVGAGVVVESDLSGAVSDLPVSHEEAVAQGGSTSDLEVASTSTGKLPRSPDQAAGGTKASAAAGDASAVARAPQSPFAMADKVFPDSYFGEAASAEHHLPLFSDGDAPSFKDLVDIVNPLQHIPVISTIYREIAGDEAGAAARIIGSGIYGGLIGLVGEEINCAVTDTTGKDIGGHVLAFLRRRFDDEPGADGAAPTQVASPGRTQIVQE